MVKSSSRAWSKEDDAFLKLNWGITPTDYIIRGLDRTSNAVYSRVDKLKLPSKNQAVPRSTYIEVLREEGRKLGLEEVTRSRTMKHQLARWITWYRLSKLEGYSVPSIANIAGYDHTTIYHALEQVELMELMKK